MAPVTERKVAKKATKFVNVLAERLIEGNFSGKKKTLRKLLKKAIHRLPDDHLKIDLESQLSTYLAKLEEKVLANTLTRSNGQETSPKAVGTKKGSQQDDSARATSKKRKPAVVLDMPDIPYNLYLNEGTLDKEDIQKVESIQAARCLLGQSITSISSTELEQLLTHIQGDGDDCLRGAQALCRVITGDLRPLALEHAMVHLSGSLAEHSEDILQAKTKKLRATQESLKSILLFFHYKWNKIQQKFGGYADLMASILSVYADVILTIARSSEEDQKEPLVRHLLTMSALLVPRPYLYDVILQQSDLQPEDSLILLPFWRYALQTTQDTDVSPVYTKYMVTLRHLLPYFPATDKDEFLKAALSVTPPADYLSWLLNLDADALDDSPLTSASSGAAITRYFVEEATEDFIENLLNLLTMDGAEVEEPSSSTENAAESESQPLYFIDKSATQTSNDVRDLFFVDKSAGASQVTDDKENLKEEAESDVISITSNEQDSESESDTEDDEITVEKTQSPLKQQSLQKPQSPKKPQTPAKIQSPQKMQSPQKKQTPAKKQTPQKMQSPLKMQSPQKTQSPLKSQSPKKADLRKAEIVLDDSEDDSEDVLVVEDSEDVQVVDDEEDVQVVGEDGQGDVGKGGADVSIVNLEEGSTESDVEITGEYYSPVKAQSPRKVSPQKRANLSVVKDASQELTEESSDVLVLDASDTSISEGSSEEGQMEAVKKTVPSVAVGAAKSPTTSRLTHHEHADTPVGNRQTRRQSKAFTALTPAKESPASPSSNTGKPSKSPKSPKVQPTKPVQSAVKRVTNLEKDIYDFTSDVETPAALQTSRPRHLVEKRVVKSELVKLTPSKSRAAQIIEETTGTTRRSRRLSELTEPDTDVSSPRAKKQLTTGAPSTPAAVLKEAAKKTSLESPAKSTRRSLAPSMTETSSLESPVTAISRRRSLAPSMTGTPSLESPATTKSRRRSLAPSMTEISSLESPAKSTRRSLAPLALEESLRDSPAKAKRSLAPTIEEPSLDSPAKSLRRSLAPSMTATPSLDSPLTAKSKRRSLAPSMTASITATPSLDSPLTAKSKRRSVAPSRTEEDGSPPNILSPRRVLSAEKKKPLTRRRSTLISQLVNTPRKLDDKN